MTAAYIGHRLFLYEPGSCLLNLIAFTVLYCRILLLFLNTMHLPQYIVLSSDKCDAIYPFSHHTTYSQLKYKSDMLLILRK